MDHYVIHLVSTGPTVPATQVGATAPQDEPSYAVFHLQTATPPSPFVPDALNSCNLTILNEMLQKLEARACRLRIA